MHLLINENNRLDNCFKLQYFVYSYITINYSYITINRSGINMDTTLQYHKKMRLINELKRNLGNCSKILLFIIILAPFLCFNSTYAQTQSIEIGGVGSDPVDPVTNNPVSNDGPATTITIPLVHDINNADVGDGNFTPYFPYTTVTISFSDWVGVSSQNTNQDENDADNPTVLHAWDFTTGDDLADDPVAEEDLRRVGEAIDDGIVVNFNELGESIEGFFAGENIYSISAMEGFYSTTPTPADEGKGLSFTSNRGAFIAASFEALGQRDNDGNALCEYESGARCELAKMTIEFNRPVNNPILHLFGLGGAWFYDTGSGNVYINAASIEFDLISQNGTRIPEDPDDPGSELLNLLETLSSNPNTYEDPQTDALRAFQDTDDIWKIISTWNSPYVVDNLDSEDISQGVANGSVIVRAEGVTEIEFRMFARAINDIGQYRTDTNVLDDPFCIVGDGEFCGDSGLGWAGGGTGEGEDDIWLINDAADAFVLSVSAEVEPDDTELTISECYRMLSTPVAGTSYGDLVGNFWIQGQGITGDGVNWTGPEVDPNIFTWPVTEAGTDPAEWQELGSLDTTIPSGTGFLISVFEDDNYDGIIDPAEEFPKPISVTGSEPEPFLFTDMNQNNLGWTLLGNPYKEPIIFNQLLGGETQDIAGVAYVFDRNRSPESGDDDFGIGDFGGDGDYSGGWVTTTGDGYGDILGGLISPFQGFFVQTDALNGNGINPQVDFTDRDRITGTGGEFYGKENQRQNFVRLEVIGDGVFNSSWIRFSDQGSFETTRGDALELMPMTANYAIFGTRKLDGTLMDIGHYPTPDEETEIFLGFETTKSGNYILRATDFDLSYSTDLYLVDTENGESIRIDENFRYEFSVNQAAKSVNAGLTTCSVGPQKAQTVTSGNRFVITTQPREADSTIPDAVALNQNYPNPFNPTTQITYELPQQTDVRLTVYDMVGRQVATLVNETVQAGVHNVNFDASSLSSGVYIYRLQTGSTTLSRKLTVIK